MLNLKPYKTEKAIIMVAKPMAILATPTLTTVDEKEEDSVLRIFEAKK